MIRNRTDRPACRCSLLIPVRVLIATAARETHRRIRCARREGGGALWFLSRPGQSNWAVFVSSGPKSCRSSGRVPGERCGFGARNFPIERRRRTVPLNRAHRELYRRGPDESFQTLPELHDYCRQQRRSSSDVWQLPQSLQPLALEGELSLTLESQDRVRLNDWSFTQLCRLAGVSKDTLNRFQPETATLALRDTVPHGYKPVQLMTTDDQVRSIHGVAYTRLWNAELIETVRDVAVDFQPPQTANNGGTGLYCGEQDMFCFLIDPTGWIEIDGEAFAPGFFVWNSEVGRRSLGLQTFWFQKICQNHLVWDAVEVVEFKRKHTANVRDGLLEIRRHIETLVAKRDARRDKFAEVLKKAMHTRLGSDAEEVAKELGKHGISQHYIKDAMEIARAQGGFTIFALVDALTRLTQRVTFAADRAEVDFKVAQLLSLALAA